MLWTWLLAKCISETIICTCQFQGETAIVAVRLANGSSVRFPAWEILVCINANPMRVFAWDHTDQIQLATSKTFDAEKVVDHASHRERRTLSSWRYWHWNSWTCFIGQDRESLSLADSNNANNIVCVASLSSPLCNLTESCIPVGMCSDAYGRDEDGAFDTRVQSGGGQLREGRNGEHVHRPHRAAEDVDIRVGERELDTRVDEVVAGDESAGGEGAEVVVDDGGGGGERLHAHVEPAAI
ncbi:hypothetical protein ARMSODRAFT_976011 [Armillaria solidipes]|uniref:Uncharacterized protein n=1 Tax=Armillaria solidipes TaxID=1076256 RepID=A0A2H3BVN5_9AGAR|nr:hypothetical protein ARMSODRAFT_976011 [Armillaria solidipes]